MEPLRDESPLKTITRSQAEKLTAALTQHGKRVAVDWAMRYGNPSIHSRLSALTAQGASVSWWFRCIRNMPPRPAQPSATKSFARS